MLLKINTKMDCKEIICDGVYCIHLVRDRGKWQALVNTAMDLGVL
jgi:hypothetical protein